MIREDQFVDPKEQPKQNAPKQTLYIQNINEKIKGKDIRYALFCLFQAYGEIIQIIVKKNNKMRGQAFIVFREVAAATSAKNNLNGYTIFGKQMKIRFSDKRSKIFKFTK